MDEETEYWVRIKAVNEAGDSPWSEPILASTLAEPEEILNPEEPMTADNNKEPLAAAQLSDGAFYGIFFTGGIIVVAVACMFAMRLV